MRGKLLDASTSIVSILAMRNDPFVVRIQRQITAGLLRQQQASAMTWDWPNSSCKRSAWHWYQCSAFGAPGYIRLSFATPMEILEDALGRLKKYLGS